MAARQAGLVVEPARKDALAEGLLRQGVSFSEMAGGGVNPVVRTVGRTGHAEMHHPHWRDGGPVNAIDKMEIVLASLRA